MPLQKLAANNFEFSSPVRVSKKSATSRFIADQIIASMAWARSTSSQLAKVESLCQIVPARAVEKLADLRGDV
jgi:hypothetical protein